MKRHTLAMFGSVMCAAALLAACAPSSNAPSDAPANAASAAPTDAATVAPTNAPTDATSAAPNGDAAQTGAAIEERTVTVSASETVKVSPDMARIVCEILTEDREAGECQRKNGEALDAVIAWLKEQGVAENSMKTSDFLLNPRYNYSGGRDVLIGYEMETRLEISDVPIDQVGAVLAGTVSAGANRIQNVSYYASTYDEAYAQALDLAMGMAKEKAEALAHAGGCQVTDILSVTENADTQAGRYADAGFGRDMFASEAKEETADKAMAVMAGEMEVEADITVVYRLLPR